VIDYPSAKLGDFSFSRFGFNMRTDRQNHTQTPVIALSRVYTRQHVAFNMLLVAGNMLPGVNTALTHATAVGVNKRNSFKVSCIFM